MILNYWNNPTILVISAIVMIMALIFHNMVQSWVASRYGDNGARLSGFMSFDPQQQLEPMGVLFLFLLGFGWPKAIPVNSRNYRDRGRQEAIVWYSGPLTYLGIAAICFLLELIFINMGSIELARAFLVAGNISILHAAINVFPVFPLDGARAALAWGGPGVRRFINQIAGYGVLGFIVVFFILSATGVTGAIMGFFSGIIRGLLRLIPGL
ncbi:MAG: site-2 protease family protein [Trueperaceae bacterium]